MKRYPRICKNGHPMVKNGITSNRKQLWVCRTCGAQTVHPEIRRP